MAKWVGGNCEEYIKQLEKLEADTDAVIARAVYDGAGAVAEIFKSKIESLNCPDDEKNGMTRGLTIFHHTKEGSVRSTRLGIAGNDGKQTKLFPSGAPYSYIAHAINNGNSKRAAQPWIASATRASKAKAEEVMKNTVENEINKLMK